MTDKRTARRGQEIHFYAGTNGGGKSFAAVFDTIPTLEAGRPVLSTVRLFDPHRQASCPDEAREAWEAHGVTDWTTHTDELGLPHPQYVRWTRFQQLLDWRYGDVLADEVQGIFSSRSHNSTPHAVVNAMLQLRRSDCLFRATAPSFARLDVSVREITKAVTLCSGFFKEPVAGRLWGASRLFLWRTYDARDLDEWDASKAGDNVKNPKSVGQWLWRPRHPDVQRYYDTFATVDTIADTTEAGTCLRCGGTRRRPACSCDHVSSREDRPQAPRAEDGPQPSPRARRSRGPAPDLDTVQVPS
jgi:hypothetical protein